MASAFHCAAHRFDYPRGSRKVMPFESMRVGRVPAGHAFDRRFEMVETVLLHDCREFPAEACSTRRLMYDHTTAGLHYRLNDRVGIERHQRADVDHFRIDTTLFRCSTAN